jgi:hypothetical protein
VWGGEGVEWLYKNDFLAEVIEKEWLCSRVEQFME